jgi:hypothetical protein
MCRITTAILNISIEMVTELADQTEKYGIITRELNQIANLRVANGAVDKFCIIQHGVTRQAAR